MARRGTLNTFVILEALRDGRRGTVLVSSAAKINGTAYRKADIARKAIDDLAEELTGDEKILWAGQHTIGKVSD